MKFTMSERCIRVQTVIYTYHTVIYTYHYI